MSSIDNINQNVIGWYHSHPHITAMPSHVDVKTQGSYQLLDAGFIGLIFSVFDKGRFEICAFQSRGIGSKIEECKWETIEIPVLISHNLLPSSYELSTSNNQLNYIPNFSENYVALQSVLLNEEKQLFLDIINSSSNYIELSLLDKSRICEVYKSSLLRLMDLQLNPTLLALRSRTRTLERELLQLKEECKDIPAFQQQQEYQQQFQQQEQEEQQENFIASKFSSRLNVLELLIPSWANTTHALRNAINGLVVNIESLPSCWSSGVNVNSFNHNSPHILSITPTIRTNTSILEPTSNSPWSVLIDGQRMNSLQIISINSVNSSNSSYDCNWILDQQQQSNFFILRFNIVGKEIVGDISNEEREHLVNLFNNVLGVNLHLK